MSRRTTIFLVVCVVSLKNNLVSMCDAVSDLYLPHTHPVGLIIYYLTVPLYS
jgi:hypothetical protein